MKLTDENGIPTPAGAATMFDALLAKTVPTAHETLLAKSESREITCPVCEVEQVVFFQHTQISMDEEGIADYTLEIVLVSTDTEIGCTAEHRQTDDWYKEQLWDIFAGEAEDAYERQLER